MPRFATKQLPKEPDVAAPDGSQVRILLRLDGGSMAHFKLAPGLVSIAVAHRTVEELWYVLGGRGEMWRRDAEGEEVVEIEAGVNLSIPLGTALGVFTFIVLLRPTVKAQYDYRRTFPA